MKKKVKSNNILCTRIMEKSPQEIKRAFRDVFLGDCAGAISLFKKKIVRHKYMSENIMREQHRHSEVLKGFLKLFLAILTH